MTDQGVTGAAGWRQSSFCASGSCVQVRVEAGQVHLRDGKDPDGPALRYTLEEWAAFVAGVRAGEFDVGHLAG